MKIFAGFITALVAIAPFSAFAATYAYVNTSDAVSTVDASSAAIALSTAPNIGVHSGVILLTNPTTVNTGSSVSTVPTTDTKAADLDVTLHNLLTEHVASSIDVLRAIADGSATAKTGALQEQDANAVDLAAAIGSVYGADAQAAFLKDFRDHITASNAYTQGLKDGSVTNQTAALANLDAQLVNLTNLLSGANPNIDNATLLSALRQHESLINQSSQAYIAGNYAQAYTLERQAITQIAGGADYLAGAIVKQYPDKFPGSTTSKATMLRAAMNDLLTEHVASSLDVLRDISKGNTAAEAGALQEQDANAVDLAAAIGSVYGADAQAAFLKDFRDHITASNAYTQGLKDGSVTNQTAALANLDAQLVNLTNLLSGANPNIDNATLLSALRQHESLINQSSKSFNSGDILGAYTTERQALKQIAGGADYLSGAIVKQYPGKF